MNLLSSTSVFSFYTLISRVLGYLRDILIAIFLGTTIYADAFFVAFRLPNTFRRLFAEGTFNAAFIPSYAKASQKNKKEGKIFADEVFNLLLYILIFLIIIVEIFTPFIVFLIAPGFFENNEKLNLAVEFTRITFPFLLFVSLSSMLSAILNTNNKFAAAAAAPIALNIFLIFSLLIAFNLELNIARSLSVGVTFSGIIQFLILIIATKKFYSPSIKISFKLKRNIKDFFQKLLPSIFSAGITQINVLIGTIIASFQTGAVSYLYYADRIYQINLAIAGIAVGTVVLPNLSKKIRENNKSSINNLQNKSLELSSVLSFPAAFGLFIASEEIVNALFGYGSFTQNDVANTSLALKYFALGVPAFALIKVLSSFYFARDNTKIPFYISFLNMIINIFISLSFFREYGFVVIPIATTLSSWISVFIYFTLLNKGKVIIFENKNFINFLKILFATITMCLFLYFGLEYHEDKLVYSYKFKLIYLLIMISLSAAIYLLITNILGILKFESYKLK